MDVVLVRWPSERSLRERLRAASNPRLLLVEEGTSPPDGGDPFEDWIRVPADEADLGHRLAGLEARAVALTASTSEPEIDGDGVLRVDGAWVSLPPVEARLACALLDRMGLVVHRDTLGAAGWPDGAPGRNALDVHVLRLRRRLAPVGLGIRTVRSRGYLLERIASETSETRQESVHQA
jgi:two-component system OmpR family response regulator